MKTNYLKLIFVAPILFILFGNCSKGWLDEKPQLSMVVPETIEDFQAMLDGSAQGANFNAVYPSLDEIGTDDYYVTDDIWDSRTFIEREAYYWAPEIYDGPTPLEDWNGTYKRILYTNIVLEGIEKITPVGSTQTRDWNNVKGSALFLRAFNYFAIAKVFAKQYDSATAHTDLGIPLRLEPDINIGAVRSSLRDTYDEVINDLKLAATLLPIDAPLNITTMVRPTKAAAYAMLARVYLAAGNYTNAYEYADQSLQMHNMLLNYNNVEPSTQGFFPRFNQETIFYATLVNYAIVVSNSRMIIDTSFYQLYDTSDLRRSMFFRSSAGKLRFYGSYTQSGVFFGGLATDEVYLTRAECNARKGNVQAAQEDLNALLFNRWKSNGTFVPFETTDQQEMLDKILVERRKQLCFRGIRWMDLKRLNKDARYADTLYRQVKGQEHKLLPNSTLYVLPIPRDVIVLSGMQQNPR